MAKNKGGRPKGVCCKCDGKWTQAEFNNFIKNNLRQATRKWAPIQNCKKRANVGRGQYRCDGCNGIVPPTIFDESKGKRTANIFVDHIVPIIDPAIGFVSWDITIDRMFCDSINLQLLCKDCHMKKSQDEIAIAVERRAKEKEQGAV
jgi:hypothetical protein